MKKPSLSLVKQSQKNLPTLQIKKPTPYKGNLQNILIKNVKRNPENPRIFFRDEEMRMLRDSISTIGLQVPISVYKDNDKYVIIDGERRFKTFVKLKYTSIPSIIQKKPTPLDNLLLMFNIHSLREQWDVFTIAQKLERVIYLLRKQRNNNKEVTESTLSEETGLTRGLIRRAKQIIALPERFKNLLRIELAKPKKEQAFSEDLFLEMESALRAVRNNFPETIVDIDKIRDILLQKYIDEIINNVTDFRKITKIATAWKNVDFPETESVKALNRIFDDNSFGVQDVYRDTVENLYEEKSMLSNANGFLLKIERLSSEDLTDETLKTALIDIRDFIDILLK
jgi:ParB/RepB/Spo0J family partition protein